MTVSGNASATTLPVTTGLTRVCNFRATPAARAILDTRCAQAGALLAGAEPAAQLQLVRDTRPLHLSLFAGLAPDDWPDAAGTYRGTPGSSIALAPRAVFLARKVPGLRSRDTGLPGPEVPAAMAELSQGLCQIWEGRPGATDPHRDAGYLALARVTARFFAIHPFMDGNGHVWRLVLPVLGRRLGLVMRPEWTVDQRPYGPEFSLALQWYGDHPTILADQLRRWLVKPS